MARRKKAPAVTITDLARKHGVIRKKGAPTSKQIASAAEALRAAGWTPPKKGKP